MYDTASVDLLVMVMVAPCGEPEVGCFPSSKSFVLFFGDAHRI